MHCDNKYQDERTLRHLKRNPSFTQICFIYIKIGLTLFCQLTNGGIRRHCSPVFSSSSLFCHVLSEKPENRCEKHLDAAKGPKHFGRLFETNLRDPFREVNLLENNCCRNLSHICRSTFHTQAPVFLCIHIYCVPLAVLKTLQLYRVTAIYWLSRESPAHYLMFI